MSSKSFHVRTRRIQSRIHNLSLTTAAVSTNAVIDHLLDDLVNDFIDEFECVDALGEHVKVLFDAIGFIGDFPTSTAVVALKGQTATTPCTHCGITFRKTFG